MKTKKKTKNQKVKTDAWHPWKKLPKETEITYVFAATDERYGIFNCSMASKKRVPHEELRVYLALLKKYIDRRGSPGLSEWWNIMEERGFRLIPSTVTIVDDVGVTVVDCVPQAHDKTGSGIR